MTGRHRLRVLAATGGYLLLSAAVLFFMEGMFGFYVFINAEALALVLGGTFLLAWAAYPLTTVLELKDREMLAYAADSAVSAGAFGTLLGIILILATLSDLHQLPRRMALALDAALFGLFLSRFVLRPLARGVRAA